MGLTAYSFLVLKRVAIGSLEHLIPIAVAIIFAILFIRYSNKKLTPKQRQNSIHLFALFVALTVAMYHGYNIGYGDYNIVTDLPLYLCSLLALCIPIFTYYRRYWMYEILLFWIIAGTAQAVITPDIEVGFPSLDYFRYWIAHLGLLIIIFYATFVFHMRPKLKSVFKSFLALQVYVLIMIAINFALGANYFYLNEKPKSASLLDYLGEWPYYVLAGQLLIIPFFLLVYLPFYLVKLKEKKDSM